MLYRPAVCTCDLLALYGLAHQILSKELARLVITRFGTCHGNINDLRPVLVTDARAQPLEVAFLNGSFRATGTALPARCELTISPVSVCHFKSIYMLIGKQKSPARL